MRCPRKAEGEVRHPGTGLTDSVQIIMTCHGGVGELRTESGSCRRRMASAHN